MNAVIFMVACTFIWTGFIAAISFMESWLKFRAPNLTLPVGVSIGKLVFNALNKVEWAFAIITGISLFFYASEIKSLLVDFFLIIVAILILQTAWLLPALNRRAKAITNGKNLPPSNLHWYFTSLEFVKLLLLIFFGGGLL
ncbi:MAG: hypothetical protein ACRDE5_11305, partial [Ginsengibacter sp.]